MGLPVTLASYSSSVIPILLIVWFMKYLEMFLEKYLPASLKSILKPLLEIFIVGVIGLVVIGQSAPGRRSPFLDRALHQQARVLARHATDGRLHAADRHDRDALGLCTHFPGCLGRNA